MKLVKAVLTITLFSVLTRILGFGFRIYLSRQLGAELMGIYQVALSVFFVLLNLCTSGLPLIVSKKTASYIISNDKARQSQVVSASLIICMLTCVLACAAVYTFKDTISAFFTRPESMPILIMLLPAVVFSSICACFRGNLWGHKKYFGVSISELVEQIARIALCILFFSLPLGRKTEMAALSLSLACFVSMAMTIVHYFYNGGRLARRQLPLKELTRQSAPITAMRICGSLLGSLTAIFVPFMLITNGLSSSEAMAKYGAAAGMALPILHLPCALIGALAYALVPELAQSAAKNDKKTLNKQIERALIFSILVGAVCVPLFFGTGQIIGNVLYDNADAGKFLQYAAWLMIPIAVEQITSSIMNSVGLEVKGFVNYLVGSVFLFACIFFLTKYIGVHALSLGCGISLTVSGYLDLKAMRKKTGMSLSFVRPTLIATLLAIPLCLLTLFCSNLLSKVFTPLYAAMLACLISCVFMVALAHAFKLIDVKGLLKIKAPRTATNHQFML